MKIVQILDGFVHWDASNDVPDLEWAASHYSKEMIFVEAPDNVFEGWAFDDEKVGDDRFICPEAPEGWHYNEETGGFEEDNPKMPDDSSESQNGFEIIITQAIDQI